MKTFKVLSIDAWSEENEEEGVSWSWNDWHTIDLVFDESIEGELSDETAKVFFIRELCNRGINFDEHFEVVDDQYNIVLESKKENNMPLYAIEYGSQI